MERRAAIIVGSGPAGAATALRLAALDPALAARTLLLDKARHPRDKTCAGGVIPKAVRLLAELGVPFASVPQVPVDDARVQVPGETVTVRGHDLCHVVRRRELDATLAWTARARGVELREDERVVAVVRDGDGVRVETPTRTYWAPVVIGADGSGSLVRRALVPGTAGPNGRAVMCDVPVAETAWDGWDAARYDFDFRACATGLRGYGWAFPVLIDGRPHVNLGVYALPPIDGARLARELDVVLADVGARGRARKAFPVHTFVAGAAVASPHALLVGDAAGVDPLMGEGISFALEYGMLAGDAIAAAHRAGEFGFAGYARAVHTGPLGRKLRVLGAGARVFYGRAGGPAFRLARVSRRAQYIALAWYNGVEGPATHGRWAALRALLGPRAAAA